jgi:hypothetical protein
MYNQVTQTQYRSHGPFRVTISLILILNLIIFQDITHWQRTYQHWYRSLFAKVNADGTSCIKMYNFRIFIVTMFKCWYCYFNFNVFMHIMMVFYIQNIFINISVLPENGLCWPKHVGEVTAMCNRWLLVSVCAVAWS